MFNHIIGHEKHKENIISSIKRGMFSHAHIFSGEDGIGKSLLARATALMLMGKEEDKPYADIIEYRVEKDKKSIGVEQIRGLIEEINKKPFEGDKKVVILYEGDKLTEQAQNTLLKTIEEPPAGVFIIILCENTEALLDTIKSRCQIHKLQYLTVTEIEEFLFAKYPALSRDKVELLSAFSGGVPGKVQRLIEDKAFQDIREGALLLLKLAAYGEESQEEQLEKFFNKYKNSWEEIFDWTTSFIRDVMIYKEIGKEALLLNRDKYTDIKAISDRFSFSKLNGIIEMISDTRIKLYRNVNPALTFDRLLWKLQEL